MPRTLASGSAANPRGVPSALYILRSWTVMARWLHCRIMLAGWMSGISGTLVSRTYHMEPRQFVIPVGTNGCCAAGMLLLFELRILLVPATSVNAQRA